MKMEFEFDKEMDALLRQALQSGGRVKTAEFADHLDADELSMFAENALPDKGRPRVIKHLADCDRCRTILSNTILLNAEAAEEKAASAVPAQEVKTESTEKVAGGELSWFQKLFHTRNLAFGMGALALILTGVFGFFVLQNAFLSKEGEVAMSDKQSSANTAAPAAAPEMSGEGDQELDQNAANANTSTAEANTGIEESAANTTASNSSESASSGENKEVSAKKDVKDAEDGPRRDSADSKKPGADDRRPQPTPAKPADDEKNAANDAPTSPPPEKSKTEGAKPVVRKNTDVLVSRGGQSRTVGRTKKAEDKTAATETKEKADPDNISDGAKQTLSNKTFTRKDGVWYDTAYTGQKTTNVRRKTEAYRKLDSGLRSITDKLSGTVVVVWKSKAYRIQ